jgi:4-carboxymuconolactone decarboxylase
MRLPVLTQDQMTPAQRAVVDATVAGKRGRMTPPVEMWLHSPGLAAHAQALGAFIRYETVLPPALNEMAILITGRHWGARFEWYAHRRLALEAGLAPAIIDAIRDDIAPAFDDPGAQAIHDYATTLHRTRQVPQALHDAVVAQYGAQGVVDLVGLLGYYTLVSMTLNAFEVPLPEGETSEI